jgi:ABC-type phosphate/phosphonate transport system substrate-binding protein
VEIWTSPPFNHCMFTARADLDPVRARQFAQALSSMDFDNPDHRPILEAEGLRRWVPPQLAGYASLREACDAQGLFASEAR